MRAEEPLGTCQRQARAGDAIRSRYSEHCSQEGGCAIAEGEGRNTGYLAT